MPMQRRKIAPKTEKRLNRTVSEGTAWWIDNSPRGYTYYCVHGIPIADDCQKCEKGNG